MIMQLQPNPIGTPAAEYEITITLVRRLLMAQHPDLAGLPLTLMDTGWDNVIYRLGEHLAVRLPRRQLAANLIEREQTWLPQLADHLPLPVPTPYQIGVPNADYPWHWSIVPWLQGVTADREAPRGAQPTFAAFLRALHRPAPADAPTNPYRGVPLTERATMVAERLQRLASQTDLISPKLEQIWTEALAAPMDMPPTWLHGDLHPRNILVENGEIRGVIDWGDMTVGDPATDLACVWMLFAEARVRRQVLAAYGTISAATYGRAQGWAFLFGIVLLDSGLVDHPRHAMIGEQTLQRLLVDN
jgi:aminoglycoside phosphotransferase (APT) family kinase protein